MAGSVALICTGGVALAVLVIAFVARPSPSGHGGPAPPTESVRAPSGPAPPLQDSADASSSSGDADYPRLPSALRSGAPVWSVEELAAHSGEDHSKPLLLAIVGEIYDVGPGKQHYGPGRSYNAFAGRDASKGFAAGAEEEDLSSSLADLEAGDIAEVLRWRDEFYRTHEEYRFVGFLNERYYNEEGAPRAALYKLEKLKDAAGRADEARQAMENRFKSCNSRHEADKPTFEIWCDNSYHHPGSTPVHLFQRLPPASPGKEREVFGRCACVPASEQVKAAGVMPGNEDFRLMNYAECQKGEQRCLRPQGAQPPPEPKWT
mmetsp:Transcript_70979/g.126337  ORF Transcript_70979/g.126337 Transcript_70979/m.126337 type:complete len:319 (-) Transcript_70979:128-1084(-)